MQNIEHHDEPAQDMDLVAKEVIPTPGPKDHLVYLNKQNRNTRAALFRSRSKIFHKWGTTYHAGKNAAKRAKRQGQ